jgi:hypothetical protein
MSGKTGPKDRPPAPRVSRLGLALVALPWLVLALIWLFARPN